MELPKKVVSLQAKQKIVMEEKKYPIREDEVGKVCEPAAGANVSASMTDGSTSVHDWIDDLDWGKFPSYGPSSAEEAIERIEKAEEDMKDPSKWVSSKEVDNYLFL